MLCNELTFARLVQGTSEDCWGLTCTDLPILKGKLSRPAIKKNTFVSRQRDFIAAGKKTGCLGRSVTRFLSLTTAIVRRGEFINGMFPKHPVRLKSTT
jgi:hypothetical protein